MEKVKMVYNLLHNELKRLDNKEFKIETLYHLDEETGEMTPVAEMYPEEADNIVQSIRKSNSKTLGFISLWQRTQGEVAKSLSGGSLKVLLLLVSEMKYHNLVFGFSQRTIADTLGMSSRTVIRALKELNEKGVVKHSTKKGVRTYHINPAYAWKGSLLKVKYSMSIFKEDMDEHKDIWQK